jgi:hypothetical protein
MMKFYYSGAPNPTKVALFLEETGTPYEPVPIDTRKGEQHKPEFLGINPNAKLPAIVDGDVTVFDVVTQRLLDRRFHKLGGPSHLAQDAFERIVGANPPPVLLRESAALESWEPSRMANPRSISPRPGCDTSLALPGRARDT